MANSILQGNMPFGREVYSKTEVDSTVGEHSHYIVSPAGNAYIRPTDDGSGVIDRTIEVNKYLSITFGVDPTTGKAAIDGFVPAHDDVPKEVVWSWTAPDAPAGGNYVMDIVGPFTSKDGSQVYVPSTSPVHDGFDPEAFYAGLWGELVPGSEEGEDVLRIRYKGFPQWFTFDERGNFEGHDAEMSEGSCQGEYHYDEPAEVVSDSRVIATLDDITAVVGTKYAASLPIAMSEPVDNVVIISHHASGVDSGSYGEASDRSVSPGESFVVSRNSVDATGHVTEESEVSITLDVSADNVMMGYDSNDMTVSEAIEELREDIGVGGSIGDRLDMIEGSVEDLSNDLSGLSDAIDSRIDDLSNDLAMVGTSVLDLYTEIVNTQESLSDLSNDVGEILGVRLPGMEASIADLSNDLYSTIDDLSNDVSLRAMDDNVVHKTGPLVEGQTIVSEVSLPEEGSWSESSPLSIKFMSGDQDCGSVDIGWVEQRNSPPVSPSREREVFIGVSDGINDNSVYLNAGTRVDGVRKQYASLSWYVGEQSFTFELPTRSGTLALQETMPTPSDETPKMDGVASPGTGAQASRWNHVHPSDSSKLDVADVVSKDISWVDADRWNKWYGVGDNPAYKVGDIVRLDYDQVQQCGQVGYFKAKKPMNYDPHTGNWDFEESDWCDPAKTDEYWYSLGESADVNEGELVYYSGDIYRVKHDGWIGRFFGDPMSSLLEMYLEKISLSDEVKNYIEDYNYKSRVTISNDKASISYYDSTPLVPFTLTLPDGFKAYWENGSTQHMVVYSAPSGGTTLTFSTPPIYDQSYELYVLVPDGYTFVDFNTMVNTSGTVWFESGAPDSDSWGLGFGTSGEGAGTYVGFDKFTSKSPSMSYVQAYTWTSKLPVLTRTYGPLTVKTLATVDQMPVPASEAPLVDAANASVGTSLKYAREDHVHPLSFRIISNDKGTTVEAWNNGNAVVRYPSQKTTSVFFPDGFSIENSGVAYTAPSGGETVTFKGPYRMSVSGYGNGYVWYPENLPADPQEEFDPSHYNPWPWCLLGNTASVANKLYWGGNFGFSISAWKTEHPSLTVDSGSSTVSGDLPIMTRENTAFTHKSLATFDHTHSSIVSGNTTVSAVNGGTATITKTVPPTYGNLEVSFAYDYSIYYDGPGVDEYSGPGQVEFKGPYYNSIEGNSYWYPTDLYDDPQDQFSPINYSVWCLFAGGRSDTPTNMMYKTGPYYEISDWNSDYPKITLASGMVQGSKPLTFRSSTPRPSVVKTIATTDGVVLSVNGDHGDVSLDATNLYMDSTKTQSIAQAIDDAGSNELVSPDGLTIVKSDDSGVATVTHDSGLKLPLVTISSGTRFSHPTATANNRTFGDTTYVNFDGVSGTRLDDHVVRYTVSLDGWTYVLLVTDDESATLTCGPDGTFWSFSVSDYDTDDPSCSIAADKAQYFSGSFGMTRPSGISVKTVATTDQMYGDRIAMGSSDSRTIAQAIAESGGVGAVSSVNDLTGAVWLTADDIPFDESNDRSVAEAIRDAGDVKSVNNMTGDVWLTGDDMAVDESNDETIAESLRRKQDLLSFDDVPVSGSDNPVKSNGVYEYLPSGVESKLVDARAYFDNNGTFVLRRELGLGDISVLFPAGFSVLYEDKEFSVADDTTITFSFSAYEYVISGVSYVFWLPEGIDPGPDFDPFDEYDDNNYGVDWFFWSVDDGSAVSPSYFTYRNGPSYTVSGWESESPSVDIASGVEIGGHPQASRSIRHDIGRVLTSSDGSNLEPEASVEGSGYSGSSIEYSRADHRHPSDTGKVSQGVIYRMAIGDTGGVDLTPYSYIYRSGTGIDANGDGIATFVPAGSPNGGVYVYVNLEDPVMHDGGTRGYMSMFYYNDSSGSEQLLLFRADVEVPASDSPYTRSLSILDVGAVGTDANGVSFDQTQTYQYVMGGHASITDYTPTGGSFVIDCGPLTWTSGGSNPNTTIDIPSVKTLASTKYVEDAIAGISSGVVSVNGNSGVVVLDAGDIMMGYDSNDVTVAEAIEAIEPGGLVSPDGSYKASLGNDGVIQVEPTVAPIYPDDEVESMRAELDLPDGSTFADIRTALGLQDGATLSDARAAMGGGGGGQSVTRNVAFVDQIPAPVDISGKADSTSLAPAYDPERWSAYAVGDYVTYQGGLYKCITATTDPPGEWSSANWTVVSAMAEMPAPITVDSAMSSSSTNPVQNKVVDTAIKERVPWDGSHSDAISIGPRTGTVGRGSLVIGNVDNTASHAGTIAVGGNNTASGIYSAAFGAQSTAQSNQSFACGYRARSKHQSSFVWNGGSSYYDSTANGQFRINPAPASGSTDPATGFWIGEKNLPDVIAQNTNYLPYASTTTLAPETAVYRSSLNADGSFPTITASAIPSASAYFQFELELTVPSTVPSTITGPTGWTFLDGRGLPDPADLSGGEVIYISVRLDCTARTFLASVWRVA